MNGPFSFKFQSNSNCMLVGFTQSGKTHLCAEIVKHRERLYTEKFDKVVWLYQHWQPTFEVLQETDEVVFTKDFSKVQELAADSSERTLIILDDVIVQLLKNSISILQLFLEGSHHCNNTIILQSQSLYVPGCRLIQINTHYLVVFRLYRDISSIYKLAFQIDPRHTKTIFEIYNHAVNSRPYGTFVSCNHPKDNDLLRFRSSVFPWQSLSYIYRIQK